MAMKAPPGMVFVKNKKTGKYRLVKKGSAVAKPSGDPFVQNEIDRQIGQDKQLTQFVDTQTGDIAKLMSEQSNAAAQVAGQYAPTTTYANPMLDANAQQRVAQDVGLTNAVNQDQSKALAALIAQGGSAASNLAGNMRAAGQVQHRDYSRQLQGLKPALEERRREELRQARLQNAQLKLAQDQFGLQVASTASDNAYRDRALAAQTSATESAAASNPKVDPKDVSKYGFGIHAKYDADIDGLFGKVANKLVPELGADGKPTGADVPNPNRRWRDVVAKLTGLGVNGGQAVILASKWLPDRLKLHGVRSPSVIYKILKSGELGFKVNDAVAKQVLSNLGPNAWAQRYPPRKTVSKPGDKITATPGTTTVTSP